MEIDSNGKCWLKAGSKCYKPNGTVINIVNDIAVGRTSTAQEFIGVTGDGSKIGLNVQPELVLIDAVPLDIGIKTESIIKGDAKSYNIAAASILAKVTRDRLMLELDKIYPEYNFKKHKGYGTKEHIDNLKKYGKCPIHRNSFIKNFVGEYE